MLARPVSRDAGEMLVGRGTLPHCRKTTTPSHHAWWAACCWTSLSKQSRAYEHTDMQACTRTHMHTWIHRHMHTCT